MYLVVVIGTKEQLRDLIYKKSYFEKLGSTYIIEDFECSKHPRKQIEELQLLIESLKDDPLSPSVILNTFSPTVIKYLEYALRKGIINEIDLEIVKFDETNKFKKMKRTIENVENILRDLIKPYSELHFALL